MKYEAIAKICYVGIAYDADFGLGIEIQIRCQNQLNLMTSLFGRQRKHETPISW